MKQQIKEDKIKTIYKKYVKMFSELPEETLKANDDLIQNVAFMTVVLEDLQAEINKKGVVEKFEQGKQKFLRENPAVKTYNTTIKNYNTIIKTLNELRPTKNDNKAGENLLKFMASDNK